MALIPVVGRKSLKMRFVIASLYVVLSIGALCAVYPFLVMFGESMTSQYDQAKYPIVPPYMHSVSALFSKFADDKYSDDVTRINAAYGTNFLTIQDVTPPSAADTAPPDRVADWDAFFTALPLKYKQAGFAGIRSIAYSPNPLQDRYQAFVERRFHGDIQALDHAYTEENAAFYAVLVPFEQPTLHNWLPAHNAKMSDWRDFEATLPSYFFIALGADPMFQDWLRQERYLDGVAALNAAWGTSYPSFAAIALPARPTGNASERQDWETFVRTKLPIRFVAVAPSATAAYRSFIAARYHTLAAYNRAYGAQAASFGQLALPDIESIKPDGPPLIDYVDFLTSAAPLGALSVDSVETRYQAYAAARYHLTPAAAPEPPIYSGDLAYVRAHAAGLRANFATRNYTIVIHYMMAHGRALTTTAIYCLLAVLAALTVNPLCAYALSRYNLPYAAAVLIFLLATMAFPTEVTQIPNFLLLKQLGMLNTFYALLLPSLASGYSIFLFKGFFDSLPKELYEAGTLDGASELRMFWEITLPLSKPIFAVIGLGAFTAAYSSFLFAILICQDPKMWTLMVWTYEMQAAGAPTYIMLAAITLISLPVLLVFVFAQNTIMKGIIVPSYK